ncbi:hypothetical protein ACHAWU_008289 [Discostella pseudostelligera]|uniref:Tesmin/TSO1-like CXC domain-containing protein n=1 Tax=Discostella pseudostelligera TaxID=259834 RepID=A0ABD3MDB5_9STRA
MYSIAGPAAAAIEPPRQAANGDDGLHSTTNTTTATAAAAVASSLSTSYAENNRVNANNNNDTTITTATTTIVPRCGTNNRCSCRKSNCILLYCACFAGGWGCREGVCKCVGCKNPWGVTCNNSNNSSDGQDQSNNNNNNKTETQIQNDSLSSTVPVAEAAAAAAAASASASASDDSASSAPETQDEVSNPLLMLTITPGRLGITLSMSHSEAEEEEGEGKGEGCEGESKGAVITHIHPECTFIGQVEVGDRIVTIDGKRVTSLLDVLIGKERVRKFGILKKNPVAVTTTTDNRENVAVVDLTATTSSDSGDVAATSSRKRRITQVVGAANKNTATSKRQTFPLLTMMKANTTDRPSERIREDIMTELLTFDKKHDINTEAKMGASRFQVLCVPLRRREKVNKRELDNQTFYHYNKQTKLFDKFLGAWASYCDGTQEDAANMILHYMAKQFPQCYVKNFEVATDLNERANKRSSYGGSTELPPNFVSHDGTNDVKWNTKYAELVEYQRENGDCKVHSKTDLGRWVSYQRTARSLQVKVLTERRIELLDQLGFSWSGRPEGWTPPPPSGDPIQNRAMAAKIMYPDLTMREALLLGGLEEEEMNVVRNPNNAWRTVYVYYKDQIWSKLDNYETARRKGARVQVENLVNILKGEDEDRFEQVFEDKSHLLPGFLAAAEERRRNGIVEVRKKRNTKRKLERERLALLKAQQLDGNSDDGGDDDEDDDDVEKENEEIGDDDNDDDTMQHDVGRKRPFTENITEEEHHHSSMVDEREDFRTQDVYARQYWR